MTKKIWIGGLAAVAGMVVLAGQAQAAGALFDLGAIFAPQPQVAQPVYAPADPTAPEQMVPQTTRVEVDDPTGQRAGTITIDTHNRYLYLSEGDGRAMRYSVGVGRDGFRWSGEAYIARRAEWPDWTPPAEMLKRRPDIPHFMKGGVDNPLGARAMYLFNTKGDTGFRIHGTNEPDTIGQAVSSGCIRLMNADVIDLYSRVKVGARVNVLPG